MKATSGQKVVTHLFRLGIIIALLAVLGLGITLTPGMAAPSESKMYVVNGYYNTVSRANLDGTGGESLGDLNGTLSRPHGIALDVAAGKMYVVNTLSRTISRANLDGTGGENLGNLNDTLFNPHGIALALAARAPVPTGGVAYLPNKLAILIPWIILVSGITAIATVVIRRQRAKR